MAGQEPRGADLRRQEPGDGDQRAAATGPAERAGDRAARAADGRGQHQPDLSPVARVGGRHSVDHQLRQPDAVHLQRDPGRQPVGLPGVGGTVRAVPGADPRRDQVQLPAVRVEPVLHRRDAAQGSRLLRAAAAAAQRLQGHHRAGYLGAGHPDVAPQHPAGLDRRPGHAGPAGRADHRGPDDARLAGRAHGRTQHRPRPVESADPAGSAERLRRESDPAAHGSERPGADPAPPPGPGVAPGPVAPTPAPVSAPAPNAGGPAAPADFGGGQ